MKTSAIMVLAALVVAGFSIASINGRTDEGIALTTSADVGTGKVLGIHHYSLKPGVDANAFEQFVVEQWSPVVSGVTPGVQLLLMKGERNAETGQYLLVFEIQSLYVRDYYWPTPGETTEAAEAAYARCGARCDKVWDQFDEMVERTGWADYAALVKP